MTDPRLLMELVEEVREAVLGREVVGAERAFRHREREIADLLADAQQLPANDFHALASLYSRVRALRRGGDDDRLADVEARIRLAVI